MMKSGITLGEILYENDREKRNALDVKLNKKNRVTVVQHQAKGVATDPRSPQFNNSISVSSPSVNSQNSGDDKGTMKADRATYMTARELLLQAMADEELKKSEVYPNQCFTKQSYFFETCQEFRTDKRVKSEE